MFCYEKSGNVVQVNATTMPRRLTKKHTCESCGHNFAFYSALYQHRARFLKVKSAFEWDNFIAGCNIKPEPDDSGIEINLPKCRLCNEFYIRKWCYGPETVDFCDFCTKSLIEIGALEPGSKKIREKKYVCPTCQRRFTVKSSRDRHLKTHVKEKPFVCDVCGKAYSDKKDCYEHKITNHSETKPFSCSLCEKGFINKKSLRRHFVDHVEEVMNETKIKQEPD